MAAVLPTIAKRTNKGRFCRAKAFIRTNNAADRLTVSWFAIEKKENERNVRDPEVCSGFLLHGCRVVCQGEDLELTTELSEKVQYPHNQAIKNELNEAILLI